jgi:hypothetical protein
MVTFVHNYFDRFDKELLSVPLQKCHHYLGRIIKREVEGPTVQKVAAFVLSLLFYLPALLLHGVGQLLRKEKIEHGELYRRQMAGLIERFLDEAKAEKALDLWTSAAEKMMKAGIVQQSCRASMIWPGSDVRVFNRLEWEFEGVKLSTPDPLNCSPLLLREKMLNEEGVRADLEKLGQTLKNQYEIGRRDRTFDVIEKSLKKVLVEGDFNEDDFFDPVTGILISQLVTIALFREAKLNDSKELSLDGRTWMKFGEIVDPLVLNRAFEQNVFPSLHIPLHHVNALTSQSQEDEPLMISQPYRLAKALQALSEDEYIGLKEDLLKKRKSNFYLQKELGETAYFLLTHYFAPLGPLLFPDREEKNLPPMRLNEAFPPLVQRKKIIRESGIAGGNLHREIYKLYEVVYSWSLSGSCLLAAVLQETRDIYEEPNGYEEVDLLRQQIADYIWKRRADYIPLVEVKENLLDLKILKDAWVLAEIDSLEEKERALWNRLEELKKRETFLKAIEMEALSQILGRPLHIISRYSRSYDVDEASNAILPHVKFGEDLEADPILLYDNNEHYQVLKKVEEIDFFAEEEG